MSFVSRATTFFLECGPSKAEEICVILNIYNFEYFT